TTLFPYTTLFRSTNRHTLSEKEIFSPRRYNHKLVSHRHLDTRLLPRCSFHPDLRILPALVSLGRSPIHTSNPVPIWKLILGPALAPCPSLRCLYACASRPSGLASN